MKILFLINGLGVGGAETQLLALAPVFINNGHSVTLVTINSDLRLLNRLDKRVIHYDLGIDSLKKSIIGLKFLFKIIKKEKPNVIHSHLFQANLLSRLLKFFSSKLVVINTTHCSYNQLGSKFYDHYFLYKITNKWVNFHSAVSKLALDQLVQSGSISSNNSDVIYNGLDTTRYTIIKNEFSSTNSFKWIAIGRIIALKNYPLLISVAKELLKENIPFTIDIAGEGPDKEALVELIKTNGLENNIKFLGYVSKIPSLLQNYNGFVISSNTEGLPMALLEAMASGLLIVASKVGEIPILFKKNGQALLFDAGDKKGLLESMRSTQAMTKSNVQHTINLNQILIKDTFCISSIVKKWESIYSKYL